MDIGREIVKAFDSVPAGTFLTIAELRNKTGIGGGALTACLFPLVIRDPRRTEGVYAAYDERGRKGAVKAAEALFLIQTGYGRSGYKTKYSFGRYDTALLWYNGLNTHSGGKKRLVAPDGTVLERLIT